MEVQKDFKEFPALLNANEVDFMIVGGYALAFHGAPRFTGDIDDCQKEDNVVQLGLPPVRIDIITSLSGVSWEQANATKESGMYGDVPVFYIGKNQYVANKRAIGRAKDIADIEALGEEY